MKTLLVLTGMMGCGKTTVGKFLARVLKFRFVDLDSEIEKSEKKTITQIFNDNGEQYFRFLEKEKLQEFVNSKNTVLSLGGGTFEDSDNQKILKKNGIVIYLKATPYTLLKRTKGSIHRPLLHTNFSMETITFILNKREKNYEKAHHIIDVNNKTKKEVVRKILGALK